MKSAIDFAETGYFPDSMIRLGIKTLLDKRLAAQGADNAEAARTKFDRLVAELRASPVALSTREANQQHYELPPAFFRKVLGPQLKYSSALFPEGVGSLDRAEEEMLALTASRAGLADGQKILELGCGWGSLTLWMARHFPASKILAVSNSAPQREFILARCQERGLTNVEVRTADMNDFATRRKFDRVVSVEMFEHMRNWKKLLSHISGWLREDGKLFVHVFAHRSVPYPFEIDGNDDWMARHFFTGGLMPSHDLILSFQDDLSLEERWMVPGEHYQKTAEAWLRNLDASREAVMPILEGVYGPELAKTWFHRWRIFFMACAELFGYRGGTEWHVSHYRFTKRLG